MKYFCQNCGFDISTPDSVYWRGQELWCKNCESHNHLTVPNWDGVSVPSGGPLFVSYFRRAR